MLSNIKAKLCLCFGLLCSAIFVYEAFQCVQDFVDQKPLIRRSVEKQELYPLPSICIEGVEFQNLDLHNLTGKGYLKKGRWRSVLPDFDDEQTYNKISKSVNDIVDRIRIAQT